LRLRLRESGAISGTVQGAVATWRLRERPLRRRQVATAPCTVPQPSRTSICKPPYMERFHRLWASERDMLNSAEAPACLRARRCSV